MAPSLRRRAYPAPGVFVAAALALVLGTPLHAHAQDRNYDNPREMTMLPEYCKYTMFFRDKIPGANDKATVDRWFMVMGPTFNHMHHYCWALMSTNRALFIARSTQNLVAAIAPLRAAVAKDPKFARAWEMLGAVLCLGRYWNYGDAADYRAGVDAIDTALRLDPNLSLAYAVRGGIHTDMIPGHGAGGWDDAFDSYARAIERDATDATAYMYRGANYAALGYFDRAVSDYQRCQDIDPAYELCRRHVARAYSYVGRTDDALRLIEIGLENGYLWADIDVAPALAARGDRLNTVSILAQLYQDDPQLIRPLFRALTDPTFNDRDRQEGVALVNKAKNNLAYVPYALVILKAYDEITSANMDPPIWWARDDAWLKSQSRKRLMQSWHLPEYWRKHGFPPQCGPIGESDFECR